MIGTLSHMREVIQVSTPYRCEHIDGLNGNLHLTQEFKHELSWLR